MKFLLLENRTREENKTVAGKAYAGREYNLYIYVFAIDILLPLILFQLSSIKSRLN